MKYRVGDKVRIKSIDWYNTNKDKYGRFECGKQMFVNEMAEYCGRTLTIERVVNKCFYVMEEVLFGWTDEMIEGLAKEEKKDMGEISDGYHTFNELYEYRLLYNASMFNELAKQGLYDVHKSKRHYDGEIPFGDSNWFIVMAELPTGQISNHYEMKDWNLFQIPEKEKANVWDGHTPKDVAKRIREFLTPKPKYPTTYDECTKLLGLRPCYDIAHNYYRGKELCALYQLLICRDAYWKIAGEKMGLEKPWEPDWENIDHDSYPTITKFDGEIVKTSFYTHDCPLTFPTKEMRSVFYENFKDLIEQCKELL